MSQLFNVDDRNLLGGRVQFASAVTGATGGEGREGSLAKQLKPKGGDTSGQFNVVKEFDWTLSNVQNRNDIPYIRLLEFYNTETQIKRQLDFYGKGVIPDTAANVLGGAGADAKLPTLQPYQEVFAKDKPTDFSYWFPYFNKTSFELSTPEWQELDKLGDSLKGIVDGFGKLTGLDTSGVTGTMDAIKSVSDTAMAWQYAGVGTFDRPRIFAGHNKRTVTIAFPLYNTKQADAWQKNKDLIYLLMSQNLYNKRDYVTGLPPVFYEVYVPGQYFCYAATMTNIVVENLGNTRLINDNIVPDAYQITLTLSELTMPSKNQFEAITSGEANKFVNSTTVLSEIQTEANKIKTTGPAVDFLSKGVNAVKNIFQ
jgi:hypothetical protein